MILGPRRSLHARLVTTHVALLVLTLVGVMAALLVWFYHFELDEYIDNLGTEAEMVATNSKAAVLFEDHQVLAENLAVLRHEPTVRWARIASGGRVLATLGPVPGDVERMRGLMEGDVYVEPFRRVMVRRPISQDNQLIGELLIEADLAENNQQIGYVLLATILIVTLGVLIGLPVFYRTVGSITRPLTELARLSQLISSRGDKGERIASVGVDEIGAMGESFNRMLDSLALRDGELRRSRDRLRELNERLESVREEERTRISREVHDELGQRLTALKFDAFRIINSQRSAGAEDRAALADMFDQTVRIVREISWELRPSVLDTLGLAAAIEWLGEDFQRRTATRCRVTLSAAPHAVVPEIATHLFRICQELLTNVARHARASRVDITLADIDGSLVLEVADNGQGLRKGALEGASLGLLGIRERVRRMGGKVDIETVPVVAGTRIHIVVPIPPSGGAT
jgi:signal transduction histidine kinase